MSFLQDIANAQMKMLGWILSRNEDNNETSLYNILLKTRTLLEADNLKFFLEHSVKQFENEDETVIGTTASENSRKILIKEPEKQYQVRK